MFPLLPITNAYDDHAVEIVPFSFYANGGVNGAEYFGSPFRIAKPCLAMQALLRTGAYIGNSYDVFLDVWLQTRIGQVWFDVLQFQRRTTDGASVNNGIVMKVSATEPANNIILSDTYLTGGSRQHYLGDEWRARYKIFGEAANTAYQFGVHLMPLG